MISELFRKCKKLEMIVIEIAPESNNEVEYEETLSGKMFSSSCSCHMLHVLSHLSLGLSQLLANTEDKSTVCVLLDKYRMKVT